MSNDEATLNPPKTSSGLEWGIFLIYSFLIILGVYHHEMWRDELHLWNILSYSGSLTSLVHNAAYEGHPLLWHLILWPINKISIAPHWMQLIHTAFVLGTAYLVVFKSPFKMFEKILILVSYPLLFEFGLISRNYILAVFLIFLIAIYWKNLRKNILIICLLLTLLFNTNAYAFVFACAVSAGVILFYVSEKGLHYRDSNLWIGSLLIIIGSLISIITIIPPKDASAEAGFVLNFDLQRIGFVLKNVYKGTFSFPEIGYFHFWNTFFRENKYRMASLGMAAWLGLWWHLRKDRPVLLLSGLIYAALGGFIYLSAYVGSVRHYQIYTISILFCFWIFLDRKKNYVPAGTSAPYTRFAFLAILCGQAIAGLFAYSKDLAYPFSNAKAAATFLETNYAGTPYLLMGNYHYLNTPVAGYLGQKIFSLDILQNTAYSVWRADLWNPSVYGMTDSTLLKRAAQVANAQKNKKIVWLCEYNSSVAYTEGHLKSVSLQGKNYQFLCVKVFNESIVHDENYYIYELKR
ncbi:hypothetical protein GVN20_15785 [Runella sp. CRIBMP]|uniref:hypothetical protein n=1 Tax=Runella sp. CRIBMP TaxID=2683261 RepID=UPI001411DDA9|nr:hypothetical protein [Runella sp. CRIBMP]NBB20829.1 hypothetical protein [Runella sp. CRIBMP]